MIIMIARNIQDVAGQEGRQEDHHDSGKHTGPGGARQEERQEDHHDSRKHTGPGRARRETRRP